MCALRALLIYSEVSIVNIYSSNSALISSIRDVFRSPLVEPNAFSIRSCFFLWIATILSSTDCLTMNCRTNKKHLYLCDAMNLHR